MSFGLYVSNASGFIQIDQDYKSLEVVQTGTVSLSTVASGLDATSTACHGRLTLSGFASAPLVFIKWESSSSYVCVTYLSATRVDFTGCNANSTAFSGGTLSYMLAMPSGNASPASFGLDVRNSSGQIVFTSSKKYVRVVSLTAINTALTYAYAVGDGSWGVQDPEKRTGAFPASYTAPWVCASNSQITIGLREDNYIISVVRWGIRTRGAGLLEIASMKADMFGAVSCYEYVYDSMIVNPNATATLPPFLIAI